MRTLHLLLVASVITAALAFPARAHPGHEGNDTDTGSFVFSSFVVAAKASTTAGTNQVTITVEGDTRIARSNGMPDHQPGQFPNRGNPNGLSPQLYEFRMTTKPQAAGRPTPARGAWFGVAVNGVPFEPGTAETWNGDRRWTYEALGGFINLGLDQHHAHVQPTGAYHYHALPTGLITKLGGDGKTMRLIGWAADGFPIYTDFGHTNASDPGSPLKKMRSSYQLKKSTRDGGPGGKPDGRFTSDFEYVPAAGDLDECNGRTGVTPEYPQGTYYYCITEDFPWISRLWHGTPDPSFFKQRGPGAGPGQGPPPGGRPGLRNGPPPDGPPPPFGPPSGQRPPF
ncbi:MAG: YHYH protein [Roseimicrobium sp.]